MTDKAWQLIPRTGIECGTTKIHFRQERDKLRELMSEGFLPPVNHGYPDEDDFSTRDKSILIRVRYSGTQVQTIEFLSGILQYQGIDLLSNTTYSEVEKQFSKKNLTFRDTQWLGDGKDCPELNINIATHEDVGGDGDGIEWVILSEDFE